MNIVLWILQVLLAVAFFAHGVMLLAPPPEIAQMLAASLPRAFWVFLGVAEVLAAVGLTLPGITRIVPEAVVWAALAQLKKARLLEQAPEFPEGPNWTRRALLKRAALSGLAATVVSVVAPTPSQAATGLPPGACCGSRSAMPAAAHHGVA